MHPRAKIETSPDPADPEDSIVFRLLPINEVSQGLLAEPIRISGSEIIIGSDPKKAQILIAHPSVASQHCQISPAKGKQLQIRILDPQDITTINRREIKSSKPQILEDGDIINIGEAGFRYQVISSEPAVPGTQESKL